MNIRHIRRPRIPPELAEAGWALDRLPGGHWWCVHSTSGSETRIWPAPGPAIEDAWRQAEPDHELLLKREHEQRKRGNA